MLLWQEYKELVPDGYQYSYFCDLYRQWHKGLDLSMRQVHIAGEKLFVDYCGQTLPIPEGETYLDGQEVIMLDIALGKAISLLTPKVVESEEDGKKNDSSESKKKSAGVSYDIDFD
jgi:hypothetical protein